MFHEFEIILWSCLSYQDQILNIISDLVKVDNAGVKTYLNQDVGYRKILNHLVNTAYFIKRQVTDDQEF